MKRLAIKNIVARKTLDSRGDSTIEVEVMVKCGRATGTGRVAAPSGVSRGKHEVVAFPSGGPDASIEQVEKIIASKLVGKSVGGQEELDSLLHGLDCTPNFSKLGGNTVVAISMAVTKAAAFALGMPLYRYLGGKQATQLPCPLGNVLGGGAHAGRQAPDIQEFISVPLGAPSFLDAALANSQIHKKLGELLERKDKTFAGGMGDEGAWAPNLTNEEALKVVALACEEVSDGLGFEIRPALDVAASHLYDEKREAYVYERSGKTRDRGEQLDYITRLIDTYELCYVEDPVHEDDFEGFVELTRKAGKKCLICGDDMFTTNVERIQKGIKAGAANAVLIKPNQIGTLSDTFAAVKLAKEHDYVPVMSHRSGETPDETIAHLAVGWECPFIKTGVVGGERVAKLNELIRIEEELGKKARMGRLR